LLVSAVLWAMRIWIPWTCWAAVVCFIANGEPDQRCSYF
jgi:hypothetical protein